MVYMRIALCHVLHYLFRIPDQGLLT